MCYAPTTVVGGVIVERIWTTDLFAHAGEPVRLAGWLHRLRQLSNVSFLLLRDGKGIAQVVVEDAALLEQLTHLRNESVRLVEAANIRETTLFPRDLHRLTP